MNLTLYSAPGSCSFAALVALEQANADYRVAWLDLGAGEQRKYDYLAINPLGRVPALATESGIITELIAVISYLSARFPDADILPREPFSTGRAYQLLSWFSTTIHVQVAQILRGERFSDDVAVRESLKTSGLSRFAAALAELEEIAKSNISGFVGGHFTAVDSFSIVIWRWREKLGIDSGNFPHWATAVDRSLAYAPVQRALEIEAKKLTAPPRASASATICNADPQARNTVPNQAAVLNVVRRPERNSMGLD